MEIIIEGRVRVADMRIEPVSQASFAAMRRGVHVEPPMRQCLPSDAFCIARWEESRINTDYYGMFDEQMQTQVRTGPSGSVTGFTIRISPRILVLQTLDISSPVYAQTIIHERQHARDYMGSLVFLEQAIQRAPSLTAAQFEQYLNWFDYRVAQRADVYHRSVGQPPDMLPVPTNVFRYDPS